MSGMNIRIASYNIHGCVGRNGRYDPARTRDVLRHLDADIIALQEVEVLHDDPGLLEFLSPDSRWQAIHGLTLDKGSGHYGNALLTRLPVVSVDKIDISHGNHEPRGVLDVALEHDAHRFRVLATHLGLWPNERRVQARKLLALLQADTGRAEDEFTILLGDFNEWLTWGRPLRWLRKHFRGTVTRRTFPARWPLLALDRIWVRPGHVVERISAVRSPLTRVASDHLPLLAEIRL